MNQAYVFLMSHTLPLIESPEALKLPTFLSFAKRGNEGEREREERKDGQSNSTLKPDHRDGGGWRKNAATPERKASFRSRSFFAFNQGYSRSADSLF